MIRCLNSCISWCHGRHHRVSTTKILPGDRQSEPEGAGRAAREAAASARPGLAAPRPPGRQPPVTVTVVASNSDSDCEPVQPACEFLVITMNQHVTSARVFGGVLRRPRPGPDVNSYNYEYTRHICHGCGRRRCVQLVGISWYHSFICEITYDLLVPRFAFITIF
jgi:hypothetical protein